LFVVDIVVRIENLGGSHVLLVAVVVDVVVQKEKSDVTCRILCRQAVCCRCCEKYNCGESIVLSAEAAYKLDKTHCWAGEMLIVAVLFSAVSTWTASYSKSCSGVFTVLVERRKVNGTWFDQPPRPRYLTSAYHHWISVPLSRPRMW